MPKSANILPNLRIDIEDFNANSSDLSTGIEKLFNSKFISDAFARVIEGFRVEIPDQTSLPGQFTVHNGLAFDRSGQIINNEDDENANRSVTLAANSTFFVEVQFTSVVSDVDARGFWDPSFNNGVDPSGDTRPSGKEFFQSVSTRITPDWTIITPVSTTGFEINTNPNSTKIPIAVLTVSGGQITGGSTAVAKSLLRADAATSATSIKIINTRIMPDTFTATLGAESITVTANDRTNGILTLSAGLAGPHIRGDRLIVTSGSTPLFLIQRTTPALPTAGTADGRPRFWQGNEDEGYVYGQDADTISGTADTAVAKLKNYIDFLSAQVREIKFGAQKTSDLGKLAPPQTFSTSPRYFESSGGLQGARTVTISIGNGTTSWGDFNASQYSGDAGACVAAAYAALPSTGGKLYIKNGIYTFTTKVVFGTTGKHVAIIGDGLSTNLVGTSNTPGVFELSAINGTGFILSDLNFTRSSGGTGGATVAVTTSLVGPIVAKNCIFEGFSITSSLVNTSYFEGCTFTTSATTTPLGIAFNATSANVGASFSNCKFIILSTIATTDRLLTGTFNDAVFNRCQFITAGSSASAIAVNLSSSNHIGFNDCVFSTTSTSQVLVTLNIASNVKFTRCSTEDTLRNSFLVATNVDDITLSDCYIENGGGKTAIQFTTSDVNNRITIENCTITQTNAPTTGTTAAIELGAAIDSTVSGGYFINSDIAVHLTGACSNISIDGIIHDCTTSNRGHYGVLIDTDSVSYDTIHIQNCQFNGLSYVGTENIGVYATFASSLNFVRKLSIQNCSFISIGQSSSNLSGAIIIKSFIASSVIQGNKIETVNGDNTNGECYGIYAIVGSGSSGIDGLVVNNNFIKSIGATSCKFGVGITLSKFLVLTVIGNTIFGTGRSGAPGTAYGLNINTSDTGLLAIANISDNIITNLQSNLATAGIFISGGGNNWNISNNTINSTPSGGTDAWGIVATSGPLNTIIIGNMIDVNTPTAGHYGIDVDALGTNKVLIVGNFIHVGNANTIQSGAGATLANNLTY